MRNKRTLVLLISAVLLISGISEPAYADSYPLDNKAVYYTEESDYIPGDCILTATRLMIRRAAIMNNKSGWEDITNESLRPEATMDGLLMYSFCYASDGLVYQIDCGSFSGEDSSARIREFESILKAHPEGIVVHGENAASTGTHGLLLVKVSDNEVYAADPSYNTGQFSEGIQKWEDTTMLDPYLVTDYWYISDIVPNPSEADEEPLNEHFKLLRLRITCV